MYTPKELALRAAKALDDRKGLKIRLLQVTDVTSIADYFLICTGTSNTHVKTLCDSVARSLWSIDRAAAAPGGPPRRNVGPAGLRLPRRACLHGGDARLL